jgi:hypothetical protein
MIGIHASRIVTPVAHEHAIGDNPLRQRKGYAVREHVSLSGTTGSKDSVPPISDCASPHPTWSGDVWVNCRVGKWSGADALKESFSVDFLWRKGDGFFSCGMLAHIRGQWGRFVSALRLCVFLLDFVMKSSVDSEIQSP